MTTRVVKIGEVAVDSGQVLIVDPCYLHDWRAGDYTADPATPLAQANNHYEECCLRTLTYTGAGPVFNDLAVAAATAYGDGGYPVYAEYDRQGRILRLTIDFAPEDEDAQA